MGITVGPPGKPIVSSPPPEKLRIVNIYVDPETGRMVVEFEDKPSK